MRLRPWQVPILLIGVCAGLAGWMEWQRGRRDQSDLAMVRRLPSDKAVQAYLDVKSLRDTGILETLLGSKSAEESDYVEFIKATGFDYREDLDEVYASFAGDRSWFLLRGRFDWTRARQYVEAQGARCLNGYCSLEASRANRWVSFFPVHENVMGVAVAEAPGAAYVLMRAGDEPQDLRIPKRPFWLTVTGAYLDEPPDLPPGMRAFLSAMRGSRRVTVSAGANGNRIEAEMDAVFADPVEAGKAKEQLEHVTETLRSFLAREKRQSNPRDLSGVLTAGRFEQHQGRIAGRWPIERVFLESLVNGAP